MATLAHQAHPGPAPRPELWDAFPAIPRTGVQRLRRIDWASRNRAAERDAILAASAERDAWQQRLIAAQRAAYRQGAHDTAGYCEGHAYALADAYAAGRADAHPDRRGFDEGFDACWDRFAAEIGTRSFPRRGRWTRGGTGSRWFRKPS